MPFIRNRQTPLFIWWYTTEGVCVPDPTEEDDLRSIASEEATKQALGTLANKSWVGRPEPGAEVVGYEFIGADRQAAALALFGEL